MLRYTGKSGPGLARILKINNSARYLHSSQYLRNDQGRAGKSPFQVFVETFKQELSKSKELKEDIKALTDETGRMSESAAFKKAKEALEKAKEGTQEATSITGKGLKTAGRVVGTAASTAWDSSLMKETRKAVRTTAETVDKATEPLRKTELYKNVKEVIDDGSSIRYGGFEEKEERRKRRELEEKKRLKETGIGGPVKENENAGTSVIEHATAKPTVNWSENFEKTGLGKKWSDLKLMYEESENEFVSSIRSITDKIGSFFEETESAKVIRAFREMDASFNTEDFLRDFRQYILPEVLDAYVKGDGEILKQWLSDGPYNIWLESTKQYTKQGAFADGRVLDIRGVDILSSKILPQDNRPVFVIGCRAQEVHLFRNAKTGEVVAGVDDQVQLSTYVMVVTRLPAEIENTETKGWKIVELVRGQSRQWT